ncbi:hypothetical protein M3Y97_00262900 [Aphelenchoides bicaudatus]|nr:hypothetical protein M3Y97_00262900 [Aphelenchoides bicaudatus]
MGNAMYSERMTCYDTLEACSSSCGKYECVFVNRCNGGDQGAYACIPFDFRYFMWLLVGIFLTVVLVCSAIVVCYLLRVIRASFRNSINTDGDIIFYNARNVATFPHPANKY